MFGSLFVNFDFKWVKSHEIFSKVYFYFSE